MHNETTPLDPTAPAFIEGINDPDFWSNFCRTSDLAPKNELAHLAPKYSATVTLNYLDANNTPREIFSMKAKNPDDAADLAMLFASISKPNSRRIVTVSPSNALPYEF